MELNELRNELPAVEEREIELLVYARFVEHEGDKGFFSTRWMLLADMLMEMSRKDLLAKLISFRDGLAAALDAALLMRAPAAEPTVVSAVEPSAASSAAISQL